MRYASLFFGVAFIATASADTTKASDDDTKQFVATVLADTEDTWTGVFKLNGIVYIDPKLVLFTNRINSACGSVSKFFGPTYCQTDHKIYLDPSYFEWLNGIGASGQFAQAILIARETGHHVQNLVGIMSKADELRKKMSAAQFKQVSVRLELQADCFAGVWAYFVKKKGLLTQSDLHDGLNMLELLGDDALQRRAGGAVVPETFEHGTSLQRTDWFKRGLGSGRVADCDTFNDHV